MKIECHCGRMIFDGGVATATKAHVVPDQSWDHLFEQVDELIETKCNTLAQRHAALMKIRTLFSEAARRAWQCVGCGRIFLDGPDGVLHCYRPERSDDVVEVLRQATP